MMDFTIQPENKKIFKSILVAFMFSFGYSFLFINLGWKVTLAILVIHIANNIHQSIKPKSVILNMVESKIRYSEGK